MAEDPAPGSGRGEDPAGGPVPGGTPRGGDSARGFASGRPLDAALPSAALTRDLDQASGPGQRCGGATGDQVVGMLGRWEATEAWCASARLGVIAALIRRRARPGHPPRKPGGLPVAWAEGLTQEVSTALAVSMRAADGLIELAATLQERLVLTREALAGGVISVAKARIIAEATAVLDEDRAAAAETLIAGQLAGKTPGQVAALIARAVITVDPEGARKRREKAQEEDARVRFWREHAGTAALAGFGLPPDEALAADRHIQDRALEYKAAGVAGTMDQLRVRAFLDTINGTDSRPVPRPDGATSSERGTRGTGEAGGPGEDGTGGTGGTHGTGGPGNSNGNGPAGDGGTGRGGRLVGSTLRTIPLPTLLELAERPGEIPGIGPIDPALARNPAA